MKLFGQDLLEGDRVYSDSMGYGYIDKILGNYILVSHSGQQWRYSKDLVRAGNKLSDLSWHKKRSGIQLKGDDDQNTHEKVLQTITDLLRDNYASD